jgi:hypothetical protein
LKYKPPGRTENCQIGTFLAYASRHGRALFDREPYLPKSWTDDRERCRAAGVRDDVPFATQIERSQAMLQRALDAKMPFAWVTADEAYGQVKRVRYWLEQRAVAHVPAAKVNDIVITTRGAEVRVDALVAGLPRQAWKRVSQGPGPTDSGLRTGSGCRSGSGGRTASATGYWPTAVPPIPPRLPTTSATARSAPG